MIDRTAAKKDLTDMLTRIFSDSVAEEAELNVLIAHLTSGDLAPTEVQEVINLFVHTTWKSTIADGVVTEDEKKKLRAIAGALGLEHSDTLPDAWRRALSK